MCATGVVGGGKQPICKPFATDFDGEDTPSGACPGRPKVTFPAMAATRSTVKVVTFPSRLAPMASSAVSRMRCS